MSTSVARGSEFLLSLVGFGFSPRGQGVAADLGLGARDTFVDG